MAKKRAANASAYLKKRASNRAREAKNSAAEREIADSCPPCQDLEIRNRITEDLRFALETLFPVRFSLAWSADHLDLISDIQRAVTLGDQLARAMPRGTGKTAILVGSVIWSVLTGRHPFVALVAATAEAGKELLEGICIEFETNDILYAYFPELIHPIRCLNGVRQKRLLWNGEPLHMNFKKDRIILPCVPGVPGASSILRVTGLLGRIRGMHYTRPADGQVVRPTLVLIDDPQTDESAVRERQNDKREGVVCGTIPGLAGPGKKTSILLACTVKCRGDLSDRMISRERHPEWHGKRTALLRSIPTDANLWNQYAEILKECLRKDEPIDRATEFYRKNQEAMDKGGEASWPLRFNPDEISAIQFGMGLKILNPSAFASEYQNSPLVLQELSHQTDSDKVVLRINGRARGIVPIESETLTVGIDVQKNYLVYTVAGFSTNATPYVIDYGTFPDQRTNYFDRRSATRTIEQAFPEGDADAQLWAAIDGLITTILGKDWKREDGLQFSVKKICIDVRFKGQLIKKYVKQSKHKDVLLPAQGIHVQPGSIGINEREAKPGEISKNHFRLPPLAAGQIARTVSFDSAEYISKVHDALNTPLGQKGSLTLFSAEPHVHRCFADQLCSEYSTWVEAKGRKKRVWNLKPNGGDNDFLDATKLAFVAAYVCGVEPSYGASVIAKPVSGQGAAARRAPRYAVI